MNLSSGGNIATTVGSGVLVGGAVFKAIERVDQGERAVKTRFGRTHRKFGARKGTLIGVKGPGQYPKIPFTHGYHKINIKDRTTPLKEIQVDCDDEQLKIDSSVTWAVRDDDESVYRALFEVDGGEEGLVQTVSYLCTAGLYKVASGMSRSELNDSKLMTEQVREVCDERLVQYGVAFKHINLQTTTGTIGEMVRQAGNASSAAILGAIAARELSLEELLPPPRSGEEPGLRAL